MELERLAYRARMTAVNTGILPRFWIAGLFWLALGSGINMKAISGIELAASNHPLPRGIASKYPNDIGITGESEVILVEDFESWKKNGTQPPKHTWRVRMNMTSLTPVSYTHLTLPTSDLV